MSKGDRTMQRQFRGRECLSCQKEPIERSSGIDRAVAPVTIAEGILIFTISGSQLRSHKYDMWVIGAAIIHSEL